MYGDRQTLKMKGRNKMKFIITVLSPDYKRASNITICSFLSRENES